MKHTTLTLTLASVTAALLIGCGGGGSSDGGDSGYTPVPFDAPPISEAQKAEFLNAINAARSQSHTCGEYGTFPPAPPVQWSDALYRAAAEHNYDMVTADFYAHEGSGTASDWTAQVQDLEGGSDSSDRISNNGYIFSSSGENLYAHTGNSSISTAISGWLNSPNHCIILMNSDFTDIGVSKIISTSTKWHDYYTMDIAKPL